MNKVTTSTAVPTRALKLEALSNIFASFESFCLDSGGDGNCPLFGEDRATIYSPE